MVLDKLMNWWIYLSIRYITIKKQLHCVHPIFEFGRPLDRIMSWLVVILNPSNALNVVWLELIQVKLVDLFIRLGGCMKRLIIRKLVLIIIRCCFLEGFRMLKYVLSIFFLLAYFYSYRELIRHELICFCQRYSVKFLFIHKLACISILEIKKIMKRHICM